MPTRALRLFVEAAGDFARAWPRLLATDVLYKIVAFAVLTPLLGVALRILMSASGNPVLADQEILYFVLRPIGMVTLAVMGSVTLAILALEQACLMTLGLGASQSRHVGVLDALWYGTKNAPAVILLTARILWRSLMMAAPFLVAAALLFMLFLTEFDINYYLAERPPRFLLVAGAIVAALGILAVLWIRRLLGWTFALPLLLFEGLQPARALEVSEERVDEHRWTVALTLVSWGISATLLSALPLAVVGLLGGWLAPRFASSMTLLVVVMGSLLCLWAALNLAATLINGSMFALLVVRLYRRFGASTDALVTGIAASRDARAGAPWRLSGRVVTIASAALLALSIGAGYLLLHNVTPHDDVLVIAHRGAAGRAPENTLVAVELALEDGADLVEIDVQESAEGEILVIHDSDFMKVAGNGLKVWDATREALREIDVGRWFAPEFTGQRTPRLEEVLALCRGRARVDIELKYYGHDELLEARVAEIVERAGMAEEVILMSLKVEGVRKMKALRPAWTVGLLTATAVGDLTATEADFLAVHLKLATSRFIRRAHDAGKEVYVWTVNDPLNMSRHMSRGVDGIITDEPALARSVLAQRAEMSLAERLMLSAAFWMGLELDEPPAAEDLE